MTQSVKTQVINLFSDAKPVKANSSKVNNTGNDFSSVMDSNLKSKSSKEQNKATVNETGNQSAISDKDNIHKSDSPKDNKEVKTPADNMNAAQNTTDTVKKAIVEQPDSVKTEDEASMYQYVANLLALLQNTIQDSLGITQEQLDKAMESLGFTAVDLLNPDNLKLLALQTNGKTDITDALTDENLANTIDGLIQDVEVFKSEQDITMPLEKLKEIMKNSPVPKDASPDTTTQKESVAAVPEQPLRVGDKVDNGKEDIKVEVYKTNEKNPQSESSEGGLSKDTDGGQADIKQASPIELLVQNLAVKGNENNLNFTEQIANARQMHNITNQIVDQIKIMIKPEQTSMELQLNPESLGKINLSVVAKDGIMTAHFTAQNEMVKEVIESQIQILKDNLNNQGLKVESIEVMVSNFSFEQSNQATGGNEKGQQNSSRNRNLSGEESDNYTNPNEETGQLAGTLEQSGSSIDYTA